MAENGQRRVGRPSAKVLTREMIVEAGLELLDEQGEQGFGMREIARRLGVHPSALYNHVGGKEDVYRGIREYIGTQISWHSFDGEPWDAALMGWARAYRSAFAAHPPTVALLAVMPIGPESSVSIAYDRVVRVLHAQGWERGEALNVLVALESFILGSALDAAADADMMDPGARDDVPDFSAAYGERAAIVERTGVSPADQAFETGLQLILDGLRARTAAAAGAATHSAAGAGA